MMAAASHADRSPQVSFSVKADGLPVHRIYLVLNEKAKLVALNEEELDEAPTLRRMGNARTVLYRGKRLDVEATVIRRGDTSIVLDRYMPSDDADD